MQGLVRQEVFLHLLIEVKPKNVLDSSTLYSTKSFLCLSNKLQVGIIVYFDIYKIQEGKYSETKMNKSTWFPCTITCIYAPVVIDNLSNAFLSGIPGSVEVLLMSSMSADF